MNAIPATTRLRCRWRLSATKIARWRRRQLKGSSANVARSTRTRAAVAGAVDAAARAVADAAARQTPAQGPKSSSVFFVVSAFRRTHEGVHHAEARLAWRSHGGDGAVDLQQHSRLGATAGSAGVITAGTAAAIRHSSADGHYGVRRKASHLQGATHTVGRP